MIKQELLNAIDSFSKKKIMVVGDMLVDVYVEGEIERISREAPVFVLVPSGDVFQPGGASNTVYNVAALGGQAYALGYVAEDRAGNELKKKFSGVSVETAGLVDGEQETITKTRIMAWGKATVRQQVVRIDRLPSKPYDAGCEQALLHKIREHIPSIAAVVISDYGCGAMTKKVIELVVGLCKEYEIPSVVDSRYNVLGFKGVDVVKQSESELAAILGKEKLSAAELIVGGWDLQKRLDAKAVLITQGPDGMTLFERDQQALHIPASNKSEVYDVTGAGDTVVATLALTLSTGASLKAAAVLSNISAGVVVKKLGTEVVLPCELREAVLLYGQDAL